ncbi:hypothetical protein PC116_g30012 [Phytophthora cactorum]|nr:hypothetical protein PC116_g30012 [Phytophthora cactorum]
MVVVWLATDDKRSSLVVELLGSLEACLHNARLSNGFVAQPRLEFPVQNAGS